MEEGLKTKNYNSSFYLAWKRGYICSRRQDLLYNEVYDNTFRNFILNKASNTLHTCIIQRDK